MRVQEELPLLKTITSTTNTTKITTITTTTTFMGCDTIELNLVTCTNKMCIFKEREREREREREFERQSERHIEIDNEGE